MRQRYTGKARGIRWSSARAGFQSGAMSAFNPHGQHNPYWSMLIMFLILLQIVQ
jgi:hypothetical protein